MACTVWHGTSDESLALLHAIRQNCACNTNRGRLLTLCAAHAMLAHDQRAVDGLLFMRRLAERLLAEEFHLAATPAPGPAAGRLSRPLGG